MQGVEVVAIEAVLQFVDLKIVETPELDVGIREYLAQSWLILSQQVEGGLVRPGVDNELGIVGTCHLCGVGIHETR
jgi:hypothetical protein